MCGIIAYLGNKDCIEYLLNGLYKLQNRGYDSVGISRIIDNQIITNKYASVDNSNALSILENKLKNNNLYSHIGIGHTRWATHGSKTDCNAHPHHDEDNKISLIHNGIIENYNEIKDFLIKEKYKFKSQTDTEVIANLINYYLKDNNMQIAIEKSISRLKGTWALCIIHKDFPNNMWLMRNGSPLLLGFEEEFIIVSSESIGFNQYIKKYIIIDNHDLIKITNNNNKITFENSIERYKVKINTNENYILSNEYPYWMIKEIYEQTNTVFSCLNNGGRILDEHSVKLGGLDNVKNKLLECNNLIILGCGTSYHAGLWGSYHFKDMKLFNSIQVIDGAEFDETDIPMFGKSVMILLSQSGETKDLHRCIEIAKTGDHLTMGIVNVTDSLIARETDCGIYLNAGREFAVASTKSFTSQCIAVSLVSIWFAQNKNLYYKARVKKIKDIMKFHYQVNVLLKDKSIRFDKIYYKFKKYPSVFILGKGQNESIAKEGSLKIKEVSYLHAEGYSSSALKHGPFALIKEGLPIIIIDIDEKHRDKTLNAVFETITRNAELFIITNKVENYENIPIPDDQIIYIEYNENYHGLLANIILQLLSYELAVYFGNNPDYPRNLAKVVTVE